MKKQITNLAVFALFATAVVVTGCKKDDVDAPVITLNGADMTISLQQTFTDPGATANDEKDGVLQVTSSGIPNTNLVGTYTITYSATDAAGNTGTAKRTVTVKNDAEAWAGTYNGNETDVNGPYAYVGNMPGGDASKTVTITASTTVNNRILMTRLADFANNTVYLNITGTTVDLPSQTVNNVGTGTAPCDVHNRTSSGTGTKTSTGFTLTYNDSKVSPCTGSRTGVNATFTKN